MSSLVIKNIIIYLILIGVAIWILKLYNIIGAGKGKKVVRKDKKKTNDDLKKRDRTLRFLNQMSGLSAMIGGDMSKYEEGEMRYHIERNNCFVKSVSRYVKPTEVDGICKLIGIALCGLGLALIVTCLGVHTVPVIIGIALMVLGFMGKKIFMGWTGANINMYDEELERDFPDLYLLLHSRLKKGTKARLAPTLEEYSNSLIDMYGSTAETMAIKKFVDDLRNYINIYADDVIAIRRIREKYRSSMIVNFVNLAIQSLSGVDNKEKLAAFEQELTTRKKELMIERVDKSIHKGDIATKLVYVILFEFVILSFASKMNFSAFGSIF